MFNHPAGNHRQHHLQKGHGFFNNDGYWDPADYLHLQVVSAATDPFAQLVLSMKQAAQDSVKTIRSDAQVNRDNLSAVVEPIVQWVNRFGPLALFVPGGEGVLALAGLIDAGVGLDQALEGQTASRANESGAARLKVDLLGVFAHPDDETGVAATIASPMAAAWMNHSWLFTNLAT
mgnify:CR=1 FL=1